MKMARMFIVVALIVGTGQLASGQDRSQAEQAQVNRDQLQIAVQGICPISGRKLGEHGAPIKVKVGKELVFLCCQGCLKGKVDLQHWATIHANIAKAQRICPIMKKSLPKNPKWTIVNGRIIYVCCPPCIKKIVADPETHIQQVDELYTASLQQAKRVLR